MNAKTAGTALATELVRSMRDGDGCPLEADAAVNAASVRVIHAVHVEHGTAWLAKFNRSRDDRGFVALWSWSPGDDIHTFIADCVLPAFDETLNRLLREREINTQPYNARADADRIDKIIARVREVGGQMLIWT